jgi:hypothetical protein
MTRGARHDKLRLHALAGQRLVARDRLLDVPGLHREPSAFLASAYG